MSVITIDEEGRYLGSARKPDTKCTVCEEKLRVPFVEWLGAELFIWGNCCRKIKNGLMADMVHAAGIVELRALGYSDAVLTRRGRSDVIEDYQRDLAKHGKSST
jgi:hypothetical protein